MCGICGIFHRGTQRPVAREALRRMVAAMRHRGPDDAGTFLRGDPASANEPPSGAPPNVGLGMARLSIIDVLGGRQPMANEDGTVWVVLNGEIYNFRELWGELRDRHVFHTRSDTEVIPHLYEEHGEGFVEKLRGMFAIALWDEKQERLILARDRLGQKPLLYHDDGGRVVFASEFQALHEAPDVPRALCPEALDQYLTYQYVPTPLTIFEGVRKLPPAHLLVADADGARLERYWDLPTEIDDDLSPDAAARELRERVAEAVRLRLVSDVPLGAFLSGGVDSSIIVGLMARECREPVKTFSIGFGDPKYNELDYARVAADRFGTDHREFIVTPNAVELLPRMVRHYGEPFADSSAIPTWYLAERTREHVTVALSGDGGDEAFGGYQRYVAMGMGAKYDRLPSGARAFIEGVAGKLVGKFSSAEPKTLGRRIKRFVQGLSDDTVQRYVEWIAYFKREHREGLYSDGFAERLGGHDPADVLAAQFALVSALDVPAATARVDAATYLPDDILVKVDIASMANSLEVRSPFLDHEVMGLALTLPTRMKLGAFGTSTKRILRETFADLLPERIRGRGKMGFGVPIARWLREDLREYMEGILLSPESLGRGIFREEAVRRLVEEHGTSQTDHSSRLWALLVLELWHREFLR